MSSRNSKRRNCFKNPRHSKWILCSTKSGGTRVDGPQGTIQSRTPGRTIFSRRSGGTINSRMSRGTIPLHSARKGVQFQIFRAEDQFQKVKERRSSPEIQELIVASEVPKGWSLTDPRKHFSWKVKGQTPVQWTLSWMEDRQTDGTL